jgi:acetyl-CoA carboxylase carboxyl transferase subunit beta
MNWLKSWVRPKLQELVGVQKEIPDHLWHKCLGCEEMIFHRDLEKNLYVCQHCGHHMRIGVRRRLEMLFDDADFTVIELKTPIADPLKFKDRRKYSDRLKEAQNKTGENDAILVAHGTLGGEKTVIAAFNFEFMGGSMGMAVGDGLLSASRLAVMQNAPLIVVPASGGARMQEGILSLMQMVRSTIAVEEVREAGLPYIVLLTDPTTGGVSASFAMLGDIAIAEPGCMIGFAGKRVIEQTIREKLPDDFQTAEYLLDHGMIDMVTHRADLRTTLISIIDVLCNTGPPSGILTLSPDTDPVPNALLETPSPVTQDDTSAAQK